jgi:hypothetical protein
MAGNACSEEKRDKVISVSRQKFCVYESAYIGPLNERMIANKIESEFVAKDTASSDDNVEKASKESTVFDGKTVQSIKSLRDMFDLDMSASSLLVFPF